MSTPAGTSEGHCWCCGKTYSEGELVRLGKHPEAAVCFVCARFLHRQATERTDRLRPSVAARARDVVRHGRATVMSHGWHQRPIVGPALKWIDGKLP